MTDISSPSVPASQNSTGEPATPSGPHVASMSITMVQPRGTSGLVRVGSATRFAELCVRDPGDDPGYCGEPYTHPSTGNDRPVAEMIARLIAGALGTDEADLRARWSQSWSHRQRKRPSRSPLESRLAW